MMYGNGGMFYSLHSYVSIEDYKGEVVLEPEINRVQAISEDTAYIMNRLLHGVMESGGGTAYGASVSANGLDTIGKTGTTNDQQGHLVCRSDSLLCQRVLVRAMTRTSA